MTAEFTILGPPRLKRKGRAVRLHSAKATALLAYLVCRPQIVHSRETIATLFWGSFPEAKARQSLRQVLYSLRRALGQETQASLVVDAQTISFHPNASIHADILAFNQHIAEGRLQAAIALYQGPLLEGIALDNCPEFDEWLFLERDRMEQRLIGALQEALDACLAAGQIAEAIALGQRFVAIDSLNEGAYRRLMRAYAAKGDLNAVGRCYRQCRDILQRELGVTPAAETSALYGQLHSSTAVPLAPPPLPPAPPSLAFRYEGCAAELAQLRDHFSQAMAGQISLAFIKGETGSGKSELFYEFWRRASNDQPFSLFVGHGYETETGAPYVMWSEALAVLNSPAWQPRLADLPWAWREPLARLVPGLAAPEAVEMHLSTAENHLRFMQGIVQSLIHLARQTPLLLFFDDLQWSDTASLELLHYAARQCRSNPIFIVGAYSSDVPGSGADIQPYFDANRHPTIEVPPLGEAEITALLSRLGLPDSPAIISRLHQHCHGNRLMLVETLRLLHESGGLDQLIDTAALPIPPTVQDLIASRLARLSESQRRVLAAAAVIGRPFGNTLLRQVSGLPELALLDDVDVLINRALLDASESGGDQIAFHHDFVRQVSYEGLRAGQRQALHRRTASSLLAIHQSRPDLVVEEVAFHYEQAADDRALAYLLLAAEQAESLFALPQATHLLSRALVFQEQHSAADVYNRFDILLAREQLLARQGKRAERAVDIASLLALAEAIADPRRLAQASARQAGYLSDTHQSRESKRAAEKALSLYRQAYDMLGEGQALREIGYSCWSSGEFGLALDYGRQALRLHRRLGDVEGEATALHNLAEIYRSLDSPRQAVNYYEKSLQLNWARQDHQRQALSLYGLAHTLRQLGRRQRALQKYEQAKVEIDLAGDRVLASRIYHGLASLTAEMGNPDQAITSMQHAARISREVGYAPGLAQSLVGLSYLYARCQRIEEARAALLESAGWFGVMEDEQSIQTVQQRLHKLDQNPAAVEEPPARMGWIKSYVTLVEGKVYCEYESPLAQARTRVDTATGEITNI